MDITLSRTDKKETGIFGKFTNSDGATVALTLEHAYEQPDGSWESKLPAGTYVCVRGQHQLASMTHPFETFAISNVPGHTNVLIHMGNYDRDSEGCVLVGKAIVGDMITHSLETFNDFMAAQEGLNQFNLTVCA